jgi:hypothetical protein
VVNASQRPDLCAGRPCVLFSSSDLAARVDDQRAHRARPCSPSPVVLGLVLYPYIPFVYLLAYKTTYGVRDAPALAAYQAAVFHLLLGLALWAYTVALRMPAGSPVDAVMAGDDDDGYALVQREEARLDEEARAGADGSQSAGPGLMAKASTGGRRFCSKCSVPKPDRYVASLIGYAPCQRGC